MRASLLLAADVGLQRASIRAVHGGRYLWATMGFTPTAEDWKRAIRPEYEDRLRHYSNSLSSDWLKLAQELVADDDPINMNALARLKPLVRCVGNTQHLSGVARLGYALLIEGCDWFGSRVIYHREG